MPTETEEPDGPPYVSAVCTYGCDQVRVSASRVTLKVCPEDPTLTHYTFLCPSCDMLCTRPASPFIATLLMDGGIVTERYAPVWDLEVKPELDEPMVEDDVIDLGLWLNHFNETGEGMDAL